MNTQLREQLQNVVHLAHTVGKLREGLRNKDAQLGVIKKNRRLLENSCLSIFVVYCNKYPSYSWVESVEKALTSGTETDISIRDATKIGEIIDKFNHIKELCMVSLRSIEFHQRNLKEELHRQKRRIEISSKRKQGYYIDSDSYNSDYSDSYNSDYKKMII